MTGEYVPHSVERIAEVYDSGISGGSAGVNSALWFTCMVCGATVTEREYGPPVNRRRHMDWHDSAPEVTT